MKKKLVLFVLAAISFLVCDMAHAQGWRRLGNLLPAFDGLSAIDSATCWYAGDYGIVVNTQFNVSTSKVQNSLSFPAGHTDAAMTAICAQTNAVACVGTSDGRIFRTVNGGANWTNVYTYSGKGQTFFDGMYFWNSQEGIAFGDPPLYPSASAFVIVRTTDGGSTWKQDTNTIPTVTNEAGLISDFDAVGNNFYFGAITLTMAPDSTTQRYLYHSSDRGLTWSRIPVPKSLGNFNCAFSDSLNGLLIGSFQNRAITTDGGSTWSLRYGDGTVGPAPIGQAGSPAVGCLHGSGVYWTNGSYSFDSLGYAILKSSDYGKSFAVSGYQCSLIIAFSAVSNKYVWASGQDYLILRTDAADQTLTSVSERGERGNTPESFGLLQNYPNPFNPATTIKYRLPSNETVSVKIYDELGREVKTLVEGSQSQGWHMVRWNGLNNSNVPVSSGVYFYQLKSGNETQAKKMLMIK